MRLATSHSGGYSPSGRLVGALLKQVEHRQILRLPCCADLLEYLTGEEC
jgi:hypothetical protein